MALRWTAAAVLEAAKGLRRLKAKSRLPHSRVALSAHRQKADPSFSVAQTQRGYRVAREKRDFSAWRAAVRAAEVRLR